MLAEKTASLLANSSSGFSNTTHDRTPLLLKTRTTLRQEERGQREHSPLEPRCVGLANVSERAARRCNVLGRDRLGRSIRDDYAAASRQG
jgi:hypothetical protein